MSSQSVVVCGTGIVGLAAALGLARARIGVSLVGPQRVLPPVTPTLWCPRVYALSPTSQAFLESIGVWGLVDPQRIVPVRAMQVLGDTGGRLSLDAWQGAEDALAYIVESDEIERVLQQAVKLYGVQWLDGRFQSIEPSGIKTESGQLVAADLIVGADGAGSPVREAAGIAHHSRAYNETGVVTHLTVQYPHQGTAWQWFTPEGVVALLPMPDTPEGPQVSLVWSMPSAQADACLALPQDEQAQWLERHLAAVAGDVMGKLVVRAPVYGFPLFVEHSGMIGQRVALVGDAAHRVHPLAGQGLNLGLGDVETLVNGLRSRQSYQSVSDPKVLARYRRERAEPVLAMRCVTDGLQRLFALNSAPAAALRNAGMSLVNQIPFIKRRLIENASGRR